MKTTIFLSILVFLVPLVRGDDITTLKGEKLLGVTVSRVEPDGLVLIRSDGIVKIPFTDLPTEIRAKYSYDPKKAADFAAALRAADGERQAQATVPPAASAPTKVTKYRIEGRVIQKTAEGLILKQSDRSKWNFDKHEQADRIAGITYPETGGWFLFLAGHPDKEKLADDDLVDVIGYETGVYSNGATTYHAYRFFSR